MEGNTYVYQNNNDWLTTYYPTDQEICNSGSKMASASLDEEKGEGAKEVKVGR